MAEKYKSIQDRDKYESMNLHDLSKFIEMGMDEEEVSREFGVSRGYMKKILMDYYQDY